MPGPRAPNNTLDSTVSTRVRPELQKKKEKGKKEKKRKKKRKGKELQNYELEMMGIKSDRTPAV